jgi:hypothetical protein
MIMLVVTLKVLLWKCQVVLQVILELINCLTSLTGIRYSCLIVRDDKIFIADTGHHTILMVEDGMNVVCICSFLLINKQLIFLVRIGVVTTVAGNGQPGYADGPGPDASFDRPEFITLDTNGDILVADLNNNRSKLHHFRVEPSRFVFTLLIIELSMMIDLGSPSCDPRWVCINMGR